MPLSPPHLLDRSRWEGLRIGLLGGSFNPAHKGHINLSQIARRTLRLDYIWWLVTPQNPLKEPENLAPYQKRLAQSRSFVTDPHIIVTDLEYQLKTNRTYDTLTALKPHFPDSEFVWLTGMDNALNFHQWYRWRDILKLTATAHIARPPAWSLVEKCPLRSLRTQKHVIIDKARAAPLTPGLSYWIFQGKMQKISSTALRTDLS